MDEKLRKNYSDSFRIVDDFLSSNDNSVKSPGFSKLEKERVLSQGRRCPTCAEKLTSSSITLEHIHPRCLGGKNNKENKVAMCKECNFSRNEVMHHCLGGSNTKFFKIRWPTNRTSVEEFLIWSHITVNPEFEHFGIFMHLDQRFTDARGIDYANSLKKPDSIQKSWKNKFISKAVEMQQRWLAPKHNREEGTIVLCPRCPQKLRLNLENSKFKCPACECLLDGNGEEISQKIGSTIEHQKIMDIVANAIKPGSRLAAIPELILNTANNNSENVYENWIEIKTEMGFGKSTKISKIFREFGYTLRGSGSTVQYICRSEELVSEELVSEELVSEELVKIPDDLIGILSQWIEKSEYGKDALQLLETKSQIEQIRPGVSWRVTLEQECGISSSIPPTKLFEEISQHRTFVVEHWKVFVISCLNEIDENTWLNGTTFGHKLVHYISKSEFNNRKELNKALGMESNSTIPNSILTHLDSKIEIDWPDPTYWRIRRKTK